MAGREAKTNLITEAENQNYEIDHLDDELLERIEHKIAQLYSTSPDIIRASIKANKVVSYRSAPLLLAEFLYWRLCGRCASNRRGQSYLLVAEHNVIFQVYTE